MSKVDRNNPKRGSASASQYSMIEFMREYPNDAACLDWLWRTRYAEDGSHAHCPKCDRTRKFHRVQDRPAYDCDTCGYHLHPTAGTIFHKSATSLQLWFYAMYLMASTRCGISAKQLERELGVTYKTAWRMFNLIRTQLMADDDPTPLSGEVEVDETFIKGRMRNAERRQRAEDGVNKMNPHREGTAIVYAAVERGGRVRATIIPDSRARTLLGQTIEYVQPRSVIYTDHDTDLRNDFEHFDERLELWYAKSEHRPFVGRNVGQHGDIYIEGEPEHERFQHFDPASGEVTFWAHSVDLLALLAEVQRLLDIPEGGRGRP